MISTFPTHGFVCWGYLFSSLVIVFSASLSMGGLGLALVVRGGKIEVK